MKVGIKSIDSTQLIKTGVEKVSNTPLETRLDDHVKWLATRNTNIIEGARFDATLENLRGIDLSGRDLTDACLRGADMQQSDFTNTILVSADLTGAKCEAFADAIKSSSNETSDLTLW